MTARRIAVVNFTRMGDLIQSGPLLRSLKASHPGCTLTLVVFENFRAVAERLPMLDAVIGFDVDRWLPLLDMRRGNLDSARREIERFLSDPRLQKIDLLINLAHTPQSAALCGLMKATESLGMVRDHSGHLSVHGEWFNYLFAVMKDRTCNPFNLVEMYLRVNDAGRSRGLEFSIADDDRREAAALLRSAGLDPDAPYVVLQPGASSASRQWPAQHFSALAARLLSKGWQSVVVGSAGESEIGARIVAASNGAAVSLVGRTSVGILGAVLEGAVKLVSNDTGTIHLAAAVGTPTVGIYLGPASAKDTAPYASSHIVIEPDLPCAPCGYHDDCPHAICRDQVSVDNIFELTTHELAEMSQIVSRMTGVRIYETDVSDGGEFSLRRLNRPETGISDHILAFYRDFWKRLLSENRDPGLCVTYRDIAINNEPALGDLTLILKHAEQATTLLRREIASDSPRAKQISELLTAHVQWQSELRGIMDNSPILSSFARYLLVRTSTVRNADVTEYLADMEETVRLFRKGVDLLQPVPKSIARPTEAYAKAV